MFTRMHGVVVPLTTPFCDDGSVDYDTAASLTKYLVEAGIRWLFPCGTTGEMHFLTCEEKKQLADTVVKAAGEKAGVFVQCGSITEKETISMIEYARKAGAAGAGIVTPSFFGLTEDELVDYYKRVSAAAGEDFPIYLYNIPQCSGNDISFRACERIAYGCPNVIGIKYSQSDANRVCDYLSIRNYNFSVLVGLERQYLGYLALGCDGVVSGCAIITPGLFLDLYDAYISGDIQKAQLLQRKIDKVYSMLTKNKSIARVKAGEQIIGFGNGKMREPLSAVSLNEYHELEKELEEFLK